MTFWESVVYYGQRLIAPAVLVTLQIVFFTILIC